MKILNAEISNNRKVSYYKWGKGLSCCTICENYFADKTIREIMTYVYKINGGKEQTIRLCKNHKELDYHIALMNRL